MRAMLTCQRTTNGIASCVISTRGNAPYLFLVRRAPLHIELCVSFIKYSILCVAADSYFPLRSSSQKSVTTISVGNWHKRSDKRRTIFPRWLDQHVGSVPLHFSLFLPPCLHTSQGSYRILDLDHLRKSANAAESRLLAQRRTPQLDSGLENMEAKISILHLPPSTYAPYSWSDERMRYP